MPDPFAPEGLLPSLLRAIDRPGQVIRNTARGNFGAAGRQLGAFAGDILDAPMPGDVIPDITQKQDYVDTSELVGLDEDTPWYIKTPVDIAGGIVTDPLSWFSFGASGLAGQTGKQALRFGVPFTKGTELAQFNQAMDPLSLVGRYTDKALTKGAQKIDEFNAGRTASSNIGGAIPKGGVESAYEGAKAGVKRTMGWYDLTDDQKKVIAESTSAGSRSAKTWVDASRKALDGLSDAERTALGDAFDGLDWGTLGKSDAKNVQIVTGDLEQRTRAIARKHGLDENKLITRANELERISQAQWTEGLRTGVFSGTGMRPQEYMQRKFVQLPKDLRPDIDELTDSGLPSAVKNRKIDSSSDLADFLRTTPDAAYERDAGRRMIERSMQQGRLVERAAIGQEFVKRGLVKSAVLANKHERKAVSDLITDAAQNEPDFAYLSKQIYDGMPPRGAVTEALAKMNRLVKPAMVYGVVLPKMGSIVRNQLGMAWQAASTPGVKVTDLWDSHKALMDAVNDGYGHFFGLGKRAGDSLGKDMDLIEAAHAWAGQTGAGGDGVITWLTNQGRQDLADAARLGIMDGFVSSEDILREMTRTAGKTKWQSLYDAPGVVFQGVEQRGRLAAFKSMRDRMSPELAAQQTKEAFLDYRISGGANRTLRDVIPFAQFAAQSIRQQGRALSTKPVIGVTAAQLFQQGDEDPVYPWMEDKSRVNMGLDEQGNPLWLTGLGLPVEALGMIPNLSGDLSDLSKSLRQGALGSTQPLLKTAAALTTGRDPYFDTPFGSYEKLPIVGEAGDVGKYVNMFAGTGLLEPLGYGIARQVGTATDETKPGIARALDLVTGGKLVSVDPDLAEQRQIQDYLSGRPDIKTYQTYFKTEEDPEFSSLMQSLREAKANVKAKREAAASAGL